MKTTDLLRHLTNEMEAHLNKATGEVSDIAKAAALGTRQMITKGEYFPRFDIPLHFWLLQLRQQSSPCIQARRSFFLRFEGSLYWL